MTLEDAKKLIEKGISDSPGIWADIGAGTGMFTQAVLEILEEGGSRESGGGRGITPPHSYKGQSRVYAVDKSPHALWALKSTSEVEVIVVEADFNKPLDLPLLDGIVMANALHYAKDQLAALKNIIKTLKINGTLVLVEYDTESARPPWVPYPVSFKMFEDLCIQAGLSTPLLIGKMDSMYGSDRIYSASAMKQQ